MKILGTFSFPGRCRWFEKSGIRVRCLSCYREFLRLCEEPRTFRNRATRCETMFVEEGISCGPVVLSDGLVVGR